MLLGARHMVAMQISHDPTVRQVVRQAYYERAKISVQPTKKGMKVLYSGNLGGKMTVFNSLQ